MKQTNDFRGYKVVTIVCVRRTIAPLTSITININLKSLWKDMSVPESKLIFFWVGWRDSGGTRQERRWSGRWNFPCLTLWKSVPAKKMTLHNIKKLKVTHCGCDLSTNPLFDFCRRGPGPPAVSTPSLWEPPRTGGAVTFPPPGRCWAWPRSHRCAFSSPPWASWCSPLRCVPQLLWGTRGWRGESSLDLVVQAAVPSFHPAPSEWTASLEGEKGLAKGRGGVTGNKGGHGEASKCCAEDEL